MPLCSCLCMASPLSERVIVSKEAEVGTLALPYHAEQSVPCSQLMIINKPTEAPPKKRAATSPMPERPLLMLMPPVTTLKPALKHVRSNNAAKDGRRRRLLISSLALFLKWVVNSAICLLALLGSVVLASSASKASSQLIPGFLNSTVDKSGVVALWSPSLQRELEAKTLRIQTLEAQLAGCASLYLEAPPRTSR